MNGNLKIKKIFWIAIPLAVIVVLFFLQPRAFLSRSEVSPTVTPLPSPQQMKIGDFVLHFETARTEKEKELGLSYRNSLPEDSGLLFLFEKEDLYGIWMKEMRFPIDIIWLNFASTSFSHRSQIVPGQEFEIVDIAENISPKTYPNIFYPSKKAQFVLEVNANFVKKHNIKIKNLLKVF